MTEIQANQAGNDQAWYREGQDEPPPYPYTSQSLGQLIEEHQVA